MGQFSNSFPKQFSYLCEYAFRFDLSCSFCEYPIIFHCLHCSPSCFDPDSILLAHLLLGLSWIDYISAHKRFSSPKTSSRKPYTSSKQQERHKHSAEITINLSPADQASSSSSVAPDQRDVARACERACGVPCILRVARQRATQQNAAVEGAVGIAQEEATDGGRGMAFHASTVAAIAAGLTAAAKQEAATAEVRGEVAAAAQEIRLAQEAIVRKEAELKALEEALAQERARKEAEERAHAEVTTKAQADATRKDAIEAARRKVAEERAKTEGELAALEAE